MDQVRGFIADDSQNLHCTYFSYPNQCAAIEETCMKSLNPSRFQIREERTVARKRKEKTISRIPRRYNSRGIPRPGTRSISREGARYDCTGEPENEPRRERGT